MPATSRGRDRQVQLQRKTSTPDDFGGRQDVWTTFATVFAKREDVSDAEQARGAAVAASIDCRFTILLSAKVAELNPRDRLLDGDQVFNIRRVKALGRRELEISAAARSETPA